MMKRPAPSSATDAEVQALLVRYQCPVPFHEVRTRFLGNIATPDMEASPIKMVESLWGGELPAFGTKDDANELLSALIMGLWKRLSRHQQRSAPFRLTRRTVPCTREGLAALASMRLEELSGFVEGLFGPKDTLDLPERAHQGLNVLAEIRALFVAVDELATDQTKIAPAKELEATLRHMRGLTKNAEQEINVVVLSCTRARRQMMEVIASNKPNLH